MPPPVDQFLSFGCSELHFRRDRFVVKFDQDLMYVELSLSWSFLIVEALLALLSVGYCTTLA